MHDTNQFCKRRAGIKSTSSTNKQTNNCIHIPLHLFINVLDCSPPPRLAPFSVEDSISRRKTLSEQQIRLWEGGERIKNGNVCVKEPPRELLLCKTDGACVHEHSSRLYRQKCFDNDPRELPVRGLSGKKKL